MLLDDVGQNSVIVGVLCVFVRFRCRVGVVGWWFAACVCLNGVCALLVGRVDEVLEFWGYNVCVWVDLSFSHRSTMPEVWATRDDVQRMDDILVASEAWFNGLRVGIQDSCIDRVWRVFLRQRRRSLASDSLMYVSCPPVGGSHTSLASDSLMYVSRHQTVSLVGWFVLQLHLQRVRTKGRCLGV